MIDLKVLEKSFISAHIKKCGVCCDFTMGNGHDTLWLSLAVGEGGHVYAFDVQEKALEGTRETLKNGGAHDNVTLILDSHSNAINYVKEKICVGIFNLGYLPGSDKMITTMHDTTKKAVLDAVSMLDDDGIVLIAIYPGHPEGTVEGVMLERLLSSKFDRKEYCVSMFRIINSPTSPYFIMVEKK